MAQLDTGTDSREIIRARIKVRGIIQGVGFRPFIYRLAKQMKLAGHVANTAAGVTIEIDGTEIEIQRFTAAITRQKPPLARIDELLLEKTETGQDARQDFHIVGSISSGSSIGPITPDSDVCGS